MIPGKRKHFKKYPGKSVANIQIYPGKNVIDLILSYEKCQMPINLSTEKCKGVIYYPTKSAVSQLHQKRNKIILSGKFEFFSQTITRRFDAFFRFISDCSDFLSTQI